MAKPVNSPFPKGVKGTEMPAYTSILAWVIADWNLTPEAARSYLVELRGPEPTMEKHQWQARVHMALERKAAMGKEHWIHDQNAIALFNHVHSELDRREVLDVGRREVLYKALDLGTGEEAVCFYEFGPAEARAAFDAHIADPANDFPPPPGPIQPPPDKPADEDLEKWFPRGADDNPKEPEQISEEPKMSDTPATTSHWIKDDAQRTTFWKTVNNLLNKHKVTANAGDRKRIVNEMLGVHEHTEEFPGSMIDAIGEITVAVDELYPLDDTDNTPPAQAAQPQKDEPPAEKPDPVKLLWTELLADFKTLRPDVTDKNQALEMILKVFGYKSMPEAHTEMGSDGVRKWWTEHKVELTKPAEQKPEPQKPADNEEEPVAEADIVDQPSRALTTTEPINGEIILDPKRALSAVKGRIALIERVFKDVLVPDVDYGKVPGNDKAKPTLLKPGAEKLLATFDFYSICRPTDQAVCDWKAGFFNYEYECTIYSRISGRIEGTGIGSCNSMESKYRWRKAERKCPKCGKENIRKSKDGGWYCWVKTDGCGATFSEEDPAIADQIVGRVPNPDIFDLVNTISKMAQKRALVAATLNATGASAVFTQDIEDFSDFGVFGAAA